MPRDHLIFNAFKAIIKKIDPIPLIKTVNVDVQVFSIRS